MGAVKKIILLLGIVLPTILGVDKYTDENRPYEFGFSIDGEQHRHEKKDENGIIMGEFGFITADGVYHVTVYATDEQGRFKILSMKNIRVKPYPTAAAQNSRMGHSLSLTNAQKALAESTTQKPASTFEEKQNSPAELAPSKNEQDSKVPFKLPPAAPVKSCSHCSLPATTTAAPQFANPIAQPQYTPASQGDRLSDSYQQQNNNNYNNNNNNNVYQNQQQEPIGPASGSMFNNKNIPQQGNKDPQDMSDFRSGIESNLGNQQNFPNYGSNTQQNGDPYDQNIYNGQPPSFGINNNPNLNNPSTENSQDSQGNLQQAGEVANNPAAISGSRSPKRYDPSSGTSLPHNTVGFDRNTYDATQLPENGPVKPMLISAQMNIVDKNTDIYHKNPGESDGLPEGVTKDYMERVLYVFNYTVGFHGHYEKGYANGAKQGYYYVTGRNGVRTRVDYEADEKGFRPKISQEVLDILSDDVPKPEAEKEPKYGLKSYEFKWLYFPEESKQNK